MIYYCTYLKYMPLVGMNRAIFYLIPIPHHLEYWFLPRPVYRHPHGLTTYVNGWPRARFDAIATFSYIPR